MGWRRVADILTGMQARDVVVKASYAKAMKEEGEAVTTEGRTELNLRYASLQEKCKLYPKLEKEHQMFLTAYPAMKGVEFQQRMRVLPTPMLRGYLTLFYSYITKMKLEEAEEAVKVPGSDAAKGVVSAVTAVVSNTGESITAIKTGAQVTGLVVMGFVALLVYLMFRGGAGRDLTVVT